MTALPRLAVAVLLAGPAGSAIAATAAQTALRHADDQVVVTLHATGTQIYDCRTDARGTLSWTFVAPEATLFSSDETVGHHAAGPSWAYKDGSRITGRVQGKADGDAPQDVPWLRLVVANHEGEGLFGQVGTVLRTQTRGGALQGPCPEAGSRKAVPYSADYVFLRQP